MLEWKLIDLSEEEHGNAKCKLKLLLVHGRRAIYMISDCATCGLIRVEKDFQTVEGNFKSIKEAVERVQVMESD